MYARCDGLGGRRQIIEMIGMQANRRRQAVDKQLTRRLDRPIAFLEKELADVDRIIGQAIKAAIRRRSPFRAYYD